MNILVTGANGQLGNEMRVATRHANDNYIFADIASQEHNETIHLDITDRNAVMNTVRDNNIKLVVNCAAYTNVDAAESNQDLAEQLNATAVGYLAEACKTVDATLFHISTDYVFGGLPNNTPCAETLPTKPTGVYGLTKLHGEEIIAHSGCRSLIFRTAWLYSEYGKNFVKTMLNLTATKPQLNVVFDQVGTPTYALDLAEALTAIIDHRLFHGNEGLYHYSNEGVCSWYDFTKAIAAMAGNNGCDIQPCHSDQFPSPVKRPAYSVLDKSKFKQTFGIAIPHWVDSLNKCITNLKNNNL